jgi:hypothetical protein
VKRYILQDNGNVELDGKLVHYVPMLFQAENIDLWEGWNALQRRVLVGSRAVFLWTPATYAEWGEDGLAHSMFRLALQCVIRTDSEKFDMAGRVVIGNNSVAYLCSKDMNDGLLSGTFGLFRKKEIAALCCFYRDLSGNVLDADIVDVYDSLFSGMLDKLRSDPEFFIDGSPMLLNRNWSVTKHGAQGSRNLSD